MQLLLTHSCLEISLTFVLWIHDTYENNFKIKHKLENNLKIKHKLEKNNYKEMNWYLV